MNIKYFQPLADIKKHYDDIIDNFGGSRFQLSLLDTWGIKEEDKEDIIEEHEALRYLVGLKINLVRDSNSCKPNIVTVNRLFNRHLYFLEKIHNCPSSNVNKYPNPLIKKSYKACRHYLFQFSLPAWYDKLPEEVLTFENKHPNFK